ncbi:MAG TPA: hypothetical protein DCE41_24685 [Cytophagales bacterium]|nr:hypothetical protein [Cytophagales bacterium]HAA22732.1 hypothetical protein [Cytophagales bacterium]HAP60313.1 hypothetical protein [Cytophagales bacterium]
MSEKDKKTTNPNFRKKHFNTQELTFQFEEPISGNLFPNGVPRIEDIKQGNVGDCWLLAALASIVNKKPEVIMNIISDQSSPDENNGQVKVKLYCLEEEQQAPLSYKKEIRLKVDGNGNPEFNTYVINKTVPVVRITQGNKKEEVYARNALWVQLIEKAFVFHLHETGFKDLKQDIAKYKKSSEHNSTFDGYDIIHGFSAHIAFMILLGIPAESEKILGFEGLITQKLNVYYYSVQDISDEQKRKNAILNFFKDNYHFVENQANRGMEKSNYKPELRLNDWVNFITANIIRRNGWQPKSLRYIFNLLDGATIMNSIEVDINEIFKMAEKIFPAKRKEYLKSTLRLNPPYPKYYLEVFENVNAALAEGKVVTCSTKQVVGRKIVQSKDAGEDSLSKGLIANHAYAVIGTHEEENSSCRWVRLYNPWGEYHRYYHQNSKRPKTWWKKNKSAFLRLEKIEREARDLKLADSFLLKKLSDELVDDEYSKNAAENVKKLLTISKALDVDLEEFSSAILKVLEEFRFQQEHEGTLLMELSDFMKRMEQFNSTLSPI